MICYDCGSEIATNRRTVYLQDGSKVEVVPCAECGNWNIPDTAKTEYVILSEPISKELLAGMSAARRLGEGK